MSNKNRILNINPASVAIVRSSHVIGSLSRAIEELVRNAIEHGKALNVTVRVGRLDANYSFEVIDDGVGIDPEALQKFIGTECCSSGTTILKKNDSKLNVGVSNYSRGESLKALAALCVGMYIESRTLCEKSQKNLKMNSKIEFQAQHNQAELVVSKKIFKDGIPISFTLSDVSSTSLMSANSYTSKTFGSKQIKNMGIKKEFTGIQKRKATGTIVQLDGLFQRHAVRRRNHRKERNKLGCELDSIHLSSSLIVGRKKYDNNENERVEIAQARACIRLLALAYPYVSFVLENHQKGTSISKWLFRPVKPTSLKNDSIYQNIYMNQERYDENLITALKLRLYQMSSECIPMSSMVCIVHHDSPQNNQNETPKQVENFSHGSPLQNKKSCLSPYFTHNSKKSHSFQSSNLERWELHGVSGYVRMRDSNGKIKENGSIIVNGRPLRTSSIFGAKVQALLLPKLNSLETSNGGNYLS